MKSGWKTLSSKIYSQNPWWTVYKDKVIRPDGSQSYFYWDKVSNFVAILALNQKSEVFLVGQYRYAIKKYSWEIVEGGIDKGETPLQAAKRELFEETGITAKKYIKLAESYVSNGHSSQKGYFYLAQDLKLIPRQKLGKEPGEDISLKKVSLVKFNKMINTAKIDDASTVLSLYYYEQYLKGRLK